MRTRIHEALEADGLLVVGEAADATTAVSAALHAQPDVCLIRCRNAVAAIAGRSPATTSVVFAVSSGSGELVEALERGAAGYLLNGIAADERAEPLRATTRTGEPASLLAALLEQVRGRPRNRLAVPEGHAQLTVRESEVAKLLRDGLNTGEIAARLGLSPVTVRRHVGSTVRAMRSLGPRRRSGAGPANPSAPIMAGRRTVSAVTTAEQLDSALADGEIFDWRFSELTRAGYSDTQALMLARDREVDLRAAERLLAEGCPPDTALRILL